jgi:hypothetical protein
VQEQEKTKHSWWESRREKPLVPTVFLEHSLLINWLSPLL